MVSPKSRRKTLKLKEICHAAIPGSDWETIMAAWWIMVDVAHRIGRTDSRLKHPFPWPVIVRFMPRSARDVLWKGARINEFLRSRGFQVKEDLTADNRAMHACLWPFVRKARKNGEKAYLMGKKAFVNGKEIKVGWTFH